MRTSHAVYLSLILTLLFASNFFLLSNSSQAKQKEKAYVSRIIDGDTIELKDGRRVRLLNINTPEKGSPLSLASIKYLDKLQGEYIELEFIGRDQRGRDLARIYYSSEYINLKIVELGLGSKFLVQQNELRQFSRAEREAVKTEKGIWKKSEHYGCFKISVDAKNENVALSSKCGPINFSGWTLKDESRQTFRFPNSTLERTVINTFKGINEPRLFFWNLPSPVWNNDRDTVYLFDKDNKIAHHQDYGY